MRAGKACGDSPQTKTISAISVFVDESGYTTVAVALSLLLSLSLCFGLASSAWMRSRSSDIQTLADTSALAGAQVVSSYASVAKTLDACVLSMGVLGVVIVGLGFVCAAVPVFQTAAPQLIQTGKSLLDTRRSFAQNAALGLEKLEDVLPGLIMLNSSINVNANRQASTTYRGLALPFPAESKSQLSGFQDSLDGQDALEAAQDLKEAESQLEEVERRMQEALERGWMYDCAKDPYCLRERVQTLAGLSMDKNPDYPSAHTWSFAAPLRRARAYYQQRLTQENIAWESFEDHFNSKMRRVYYQYALEQMNASYYVPAKDGSVDLNFEILFRNADELRAAPLYGRALWPWSSEEQGPTLHFDESCPGATAPFGGMASLAQLEAGDYHECLHCRMSIGDLSSVAAASSSIDNGFEYYWIAIAQAAQDYENAKAQYVQTQKQFEQAQQKAEGFFEKALAQLALPRPKLCPPGAFGCVSVVVRPHELESPPALENVFIKSQQVFAGAAIAGAVLAPDSDTDHATIFASFFDELAQGDKGLGAGQLIDDVCELFGDLLVSYGAAYQKIGETGSKVFDVLEYTGPWANALKNKLSQMVESLGLAPADLRQLKPVLVNSHDILAKSGYDHDESVRSFIAAIPDSEDPHDLLRAFGQSIQDKLSEQTITVATIVLPGTDKEIPLTIDLAWLRDVS